MHPCDCDQICHYWCRLGFVRSARFRPHENCLTFISHVTQLKDNRPQTHCNHRGVDHQMQQITGPWRGWWQHLWIGCSDSTIATHSNGTIATQFADLPKSNVVPPDACHTSMSGNDKAIAIVEKCGGAKDLGDGTLIRYFVIVVGQRMFVGAARMLTVLSPSIWAWILMFMMTCKFVLVGMSSASYIQIGLDMRRLRINLLDSPKGIRPPHVGSVTSATGIILESG